MGSVAQFEEDRKELVKDVAVHNQRVAVFSQEEDGIQFTTKVDYVFLMWVS